MVKPNRPTLPAIAGPTGPQTATNRRRPRRRRRRRLRENARRRSTGVMACRFMVQVMRLSVRSTVMRAVTSATSAATTGTQAKIPHCTGVKMAPAAGSSSTLPARWATPKTVPIAKAMPTIAPCRLSHSACRSNWRAIYRSWAPIRWQQADDPAMDAQAGSRGEDDGDNRCQPDKGNDQQRDQPDRPRQADQPAGPAGMIFRDRAGAAAATLAARPPYRSRLRPQP